MNNIFTTHPQSLGETYGEHSKEALFCGFIMIVSGFACMVHALLPFLFLKTASRNVSYLSQRFEKRKALKQQNI